MARPRVAAEAEDVVLALRAEAQDPMAEAVAAAAANAGRELAEATYALESWRC
ncbi:MAG: hypothetical protein ACRBK7_21975 [Acidimicrobiales bacterium]